MFISFICANLSNFFSFFEKETVRSHGCFYHCKLYISIISPVEESADVFVMLPDAPPVDCLDI